MMRRLFTLTVVFISMLCFTAKAQIITANPEFPTADGTVTITYDATEGNQGLMGYTGDVYAHTGLITSESTSGSDWKYAPEWGDNSEKYKLTRVGTDLYELEITPTIREYYGAGAQEELLQMAFVFRSSDKTKEGKDVGNTNIYYEIYEDVLSAKFTLPTPNSFANIDDIVDWSISISDIADYNVYVNNVEIASGNGTNESGQYTITAKGNYWFKVIASAGGETSADSTIVVVREDILNEALPVGYIKGVNYTSSTSAGFVLWAPDKEFVYLLGDFNDWILQNEYQMKKDGDYFWLDVDGLISGQQYVYQFYIDGELYIADPYTEQVSDPSHDNSISEETYPGLVKYPHGKTDGIASVMIPGQTPFLWEVTDFTPPEKSKMVVYELLIRDFHGNHSYKAVRENLDYLEELGVNVLELMPVNEFEGNESWGYNPSFYFAPDKYYGPKDELKKLIDECHKRGIAVVIDMVLNHSFSQSPFAQMYLEGGKPAANNPWYNIDAPHTCYGWGYDFDHESVHTEELVDSVNTFWLTEYKIDGFRFDFTKGFTNNNVNCGWDKDNDRINILKRMADEIWKINPNAYVIFEHLADNSEETILSDYGIMLWGNMNHNYSENLMGWHENNKSDLSWGYYESRGWSEPNLVTYGESHDEERNMFKAVTWGNEEGDYSVKDTITALDRQGANVAFLMAIPGPKMIWQFQELGYDYSIDYNGRVGNKPIRWDYLNDNNRQKLYYRFSEFNMFKTTYPEFYNPDNFDPDIDNGALKSIILSSGDNHAVVLGNFDVIERDMTITFPSTGVYSDYFVQKTYNIENVEQTIKLKPGQFKLYTTRDFGFFPVSTEETELSKAESISVYPNPAQSQITIDQVNVVTVEIYTITGQLIKVEHFETESKPTLNIVDLQAGMYFAKSTDTNNNVYSGKFLKTE
jgi:1,4-alpha-glucan branching enzyme